MFPSSGRGRGGHPFQKGGCWRLGEEVDREGQRLKHNRGGMLVMHGQNESLERTMLLMVMKMKI